MKEVSDTDLIFWLSEAEMLAAYINDYSIAKDYVKVKNVVEDFRKSLMTYNEVLNRYKKSKVVNAKILQKGQEFSEYGDIVLDTCYKFLRKNLKVLETSETQQPDFH